MPIFARRRIQKMLDDIQPKIQAGKAKDLLRRLENKRPEQALPAEAELALLWALDGATSVEIEPEWKGKSCRVEAIAHDLFVNQPAAIEITAISDFSFSGKEAMNQVAEKFVKLANSFRKKSGKHLFFEFASSSGYENGQFQRVRHVVPKYNLTDEDKAILKNWIKNPAWPNPDRIRIKNDDLDVTISWKEYVHPEGRTFCSMPAVAYDLEDNPLFKRMKEKWKHQLSKAPEGYLRCLFIADAGCRLLNNLGGFGSIWETSGRDIINHFLAQKSIDIICVFSPSPQLTLDFHSRELVWKFTVFDRRTSRSDSDYKQLKKITSLLPPPRYEGYQAHSLHRQNIFKPQSEGQYLGNEIITNGRSTAMTIKISSRLVLELLAGRISTKRFEQMAFGNHQNQFEYELRQGLMISSAHIESGGIDEDDDRLVFELGQDPAASEFELTDRSKGND